MWGFNIGKPSQDEQSVGTERVFHLRRRLLVLVLIAVIPALALILFNAAEERNLRLSAIRDEAQRIVQLAAIRHNRLIDSSRQLLTTLAEIPSVRNSDSSCARILARVLEGYGYYGNLGVIRPDGSLLCSAVEIDRLTNHAERSYFRRAIETKAFSTGDYQIGKNTGKASIVFGLPVFNEWGAVLAVLFAALDLNWLDTLAADIELPHGSTLSIFDNRGIVLSSFPYPDKWVGKKVSDSPIFELARVQHRGVEELDGLDGVPRLYAFTMLGSKRDTSGAYIVAGIPKGLADIEAQQALLLNLFWLGVVTLLAIAVPWFLGRHFIIRYVEERNRAEEARLQLAAIVESSEDAIIAKTLEGKISAWNAGAERIYGYSAEEVLGSPATLLNPPDRPNEIPQILEIVKQGKGLNRYETERIRKDGRRLCISASVSPIRDHDGKIIGASTIARDITHSKKVEEKLRTHASQMEALYTVAQDVGGTLALNEVLQRALNRVVLASGFELAFIHFWTAESAPKVYGVGSGATAPADALQILRRIGEKFEKRIIDCKQPWLVENTEAVPDLEVVYAAAGMRGLAVLPLSANEQFRGALTLMNSRSHSFLPEEAQFLPALAQQIGLAIANASLYGATVRVNEHLQEEVEVRKRTEKTLADFTAMVVHDLRSPLSNLVSIVESMRHELFGPVTEQQSKWLQKMQNNCISLIDHISDFLDFSKIEAGHAEVVKKPENLGALIYDSLIEHSVQADKSNIRLNMEVEKDLPSIPLDARRLNQVLGNLLSNALKFTSEGGQVEVGACKASESDVVVWVKDTGIGIPEEELGEMFEAYRQLSGGKNSHHAGTGLGLAICKKIVEAHGGRIWVNSEENKGTIFSFSLPLDPRAPAGSSSSAGLST